MAVGHRFLFCGGVTTLAFMLLSVLAVAFPGIRGAMLRVGMPAMLFLLGSLWSFMRLPWFFGWILPTIFFLLFAFLRLEGLQSLGLLPGYLILTLAGALAARCLLVLKARDALEDEDARQSK